MHFCDYCMPISALYYWQWCYITLYLRFCLSTLPDLWPYLSSELANVSTRTWTFISASSVFWNMDAQWNSRINKVHNVVLQAAPHHIIFVHFSCGISVLCCLLLFPKNQHLWSHNKHSQDSNSVEIITVHEFLWTSRRRHWRRHWRRQWRRHWRRQWGDSRNRDKAEPF